MSDLAPLFAAVHPALRDETVTEQQNEIVRLKAELREQKRVSITLQFVGGPHGQGTEEEQRNRIVAVGNLDDAEPVPAGQKPTSWLDYPRYRDYPLQVVRLKPVEGAELISADTHLNYEGCVEIRLGPARGLVALSSFEGGIDVPEGEEAEGCCQRAMCDFDDDFGFAFVDGRRKFACIRFKYIAKEGAKPNWRYNSDGSKSYLDNDGDFTMEFDALYLAVMPKEEEEEDDDEQAKRETEEVDNDEVTSNNEGNAGGASDDDAQSDTSSFATCFEVERTEVEELEEEEPIGDGIQNLTLGDPPTNFLEQRRRHDMGEYPSRF